MYSDFFYFTQHPNFIGFGDVSKEFVLKLEKRTLQQSSDETVTTYAVKLGEWGDSTHPSAKLTEVRLIYDATVESLDVFAQALIL